MSLHARRDRQWLRWIGLLCCGLVLWAWIDSGWNWISWERTFATIDTRCGRIEFGVPGDPAFAGNAGVDWGYADSFYMTWRLPSASISAGRVAVMIPHWLLFAAFAVPTGLLWRRRWKGPPPQTCPRCWYDLTGNRSGTCPECGREVGA